MTASENDFEIAKAVSDQLKGIDKDRQKRILRWVAESLSLDFGIAPVVERTAAGTGAGPGLATPAQTDLHAAQRQHARVDIKTFADSKEPKSDVQFATVVAYYYRFEAPVEARKDQIDADVLQGAARLAGRRRLPDPLKTLNNSKSRGYLDSSERGKFRINSVGENLVAMTLPSGRPESVSRKSRSKKRAKSKAKKKR